MECFTLPRTPACMWKTLSSTQWPRTPTTAAEPCKVWNITSARWLSHPLMYPMNLRHQHHRADQCSQQSCSPSPTWLPGHSTRTGFHHQHLSAQHNRAAAGPVPCYQPQPDQLQHHSADRRCSGDGYRASVRRRQRAHLLSGDGCATSALGGMDCDSCGRCCVGNLSHSKGDELSWSSQQRGVLHRAGNRQRSTRPGVHVQAQQQAPGQAVQTWTVLFRPVHQVRCWQQSISAAYGGLDRRVDRRWPPFDSLGLILQICLLQQD